MCWQQLRSAVARRIRYKVTRGGVLFTFAILVVGLGAIVSANNLLFLIVATMLATLLVSGLVSRLCLAGLELDFQVPGPCAGEAPGSRQDLRAQSKWLMPSFSIRVEAIRDPGQSDAPLGRVLPARRGERDGR